MTYLFFRFFSVEVIDISVHTDRNPWMCAWDTHTLKYLYLSAGPLCGWAGYIDRYLFVCVLCLCVYAQPHSVSLPDGSRLFRGGSMRLTDWVRVQWKERLLVEIPLFATRLLCWSTLLRVIVHNVTSIDWTDGKRQPEREKNIFLSQTVFFAAFYAASLSRHAARNRWIVLAMHVCKSWNYIYTVLWVWFSAPIKVGSQHLVFIRGRVGFSAKLLKSAFKG